MQISSLGFRLSTSAATSFTRFFQDTSSIPQTSTTPNNFFLLLPFYIPQWRPTPCPLEHPRPLPLIFSPTDKITVAVTERLNTYTKHIFLGLTAPEIPLPKKHKSLSCGTGFRHLLLDGDPLSKPTLILRTSWGKSGMNCLQTSFEWTELTCL